MKIRAISLENFRSHVRTELNFGDGIVAIIGENGAGKTSILEAIAYALFPDLFRGRTDSLMRDGTDYLRVSLEFEVNGKAYRVIRERPRVGQPTAIIEELGEKRRVLQRGQRNVNKQILELLGMSPEVLISAVYVRQGEIADLIEESPTERRKLIAKLMKVDQLERIWDDLGSAISHFRSELASVKGELTALHGAEGELIELKRKRDLLQVRKEELSGKLEDLMKEKAEVERRLDEVQRRQEVYMEVKSELDRKVGEAQHLEEKIRRLKRDLAIISERINKYKERVSSLGNLEIAMEAYRIHSEVDKISSEIRRVKDWRDRVNSIREELDSIEVDESSSQRYIEVKSAISKIQAEISSNREEVGALRSKLIEKKERMANLISEARKRMSRLSSITGLEVNSLEEVDEVNGFIKELEERLAKLEERRDLIIKELSALDARIKEYRRSLESLKGARGKCPVCGSELSDERRSELMDEFREEIFRSEKKRLELDKELADIKESIQEVSAKLNMLRSFDLNSLKELFTTIPSLESEIRKLENSLALKRSALVELEGKLSKLVDERDRLEGEVKKLERKRYLRNLLMTELRKGRNLPDLDQLESKLRELRERLSDLAAKLGLDVDRVGSIREKVIEVKRLLEELDRLKGRKSAVEEELENLEKRLNSARMEISKLKSSLESVGYSKEEHLSLIKRLKELNSLKSSAERELGSLEGEIRRLEEEIKRKESEVKKLKELRRRAKSLEEYIGILEEVRDIFHRERGIQRYIREKARPFIEEKASEIFSSFGFQYDGLEIDRDYTPYLIKGTRRYGMDKMSGGELIAVALSLRLALANFLVASEVESIFLDEPTIHLDESRVDSLVDSLTHMEVPQLIVVTHSDKFMNVADQTILVKKEKGVSGVEVIQTSNKGYP